MPAFMPASPVEPRAVGTGRGTDRSLPAGPVSCESNGRRPTPTAASGAVPPTAVGPDSSFGLVAGWSDQLGEGGKPAPKIDQSRRCLLTPVPVDTIMP